MNSDFRRQCESALTHPVTVAALGMLLVNDLLLKSLWPDSWITGKLSDLAWVIFASPLLAFLLSFIVEVSRLRQKDAFVGSYIGLPLLYAAFNTLVPVHDAILGVISTVSGGTAGSPMDVTDSLVIPVGLGVALWVWRRPRILPDSLRARTCLLVACVAALASIATSYPDVLYGITNVGTSSDGAVYASASSLEYFPQRPQYQSNDGGLTWGGTTGEPDEIEWGARNAETPAGRYMIHGTNVVRLNQAEEQETVYSARYLRESSNVWVQERTQQDSAGHMDLHPRPHSMTYHPSSGNLIVAMGTQGVVVGSPDGKWVRAAVGSYSPTDFSPSTKMRLLLRDVNFRMTALSIAVAMMAMALAVSRYRRVDLRADIGAFALPAGAMAAGLTFLLATSFNDEGSALPLLSGPLLVLAAWVCAIAARFKPDGSKARRDLELNMGVPSLLLASVLLFTFGVTNNSPVASGLDYIRLIYPIAALLSALPVVVYFWRTIVRHLLAVVIAFIGMNALVVLGFLLWINLNLDLVFTQVSTAALVALTAIAFVGCAYRKQRPWY